MIRKDKCKTNNKYLIAFYTNFILNNKANVRMKVSISRSNVPDLAYF